MTHLTWWAVGIGLSLLVGCATQQTLDFASPEEAVQALVRASDDRELADALLGPGGFAMLQSGDEVADQRDAETVRALIAERVAFEDDGEGRTIAVLGDAGWELPVPLVELNGRWSFDVAAGQEEILCRRVGRNELSTIATLRAIVAAQLEYATVGHDGAPGAYAARVMSTPGHRDGLYWPVGAGETESPLGPLVAAATAEGYDFDPRSRQPVPYHGYFFRMLTAQGEHAPGGARSYVDADGRLSGGFAVVAWPASWGNSGVMTFQANRLGIVFEKNLGPDTAKLIAAIVAYDPDASWAPTRD